MGVGVEPLPQYFGHFYHQVYPHWKRFSFTRNSCHLFVLMQSHTSSLFPYNVQYMIKDEEVVYSIQVSVVLGCRTPVRELPLCVSQCTASEQSKWAGAALSNWAAPSAFLWPNCSRSARKWSQWTRARRPGPPFDWTGEWPTCPTFIPSSCSSRSAPSHSCHCHLTLHFTHICYFTFSLGSSFLATRTSVKLTLFKSPMVVSMWLDSQWIKLFLCWHDSENPLSIWTLKKYPVFFLWWCWWYVFHNNLSLGRQGVTFLRWKGFQEETMSISSTSWWPLWSLGEQLSSHNL